MLWLGDVAARGSGSASIDKTNLKCHVAAVVQALTPHAHSYLSGPAIQETVEAAVDRPDLWEACTSGMVRGWEAKGTLVRPHHHAFSHVCHHVAIPPPVLVVLSALALSSGLGRLGRPRRPQQPST